MNINSRLILASMILASMMPSTTRAEIRVHPIFGDNMVMQRNSEIKVWGTANPSSQITVNFAEQTSRTHSDEEGNWQVVLDAMSANSTGQDLTIQSGDSSIQIQNVLIGDVWLCGGQSNMEFSLERIYQGDIEIASANHPNIRLMTIPKAAKPVVMNSFEPLNEFNSWNNEYELKGTWQVCSPETVNRFASIGYIFARRLHLVTGIPIGIIDNSVGGTTVEGWTSRESLSKIPEASGLLKDWDQRIAAWDSEKDLADRIQRWEKDSERRQANGQQPREKPEDLRPGPAFDRNNPGASYNAMLASFAGTKLAGIIFHQGYNNALGDSRPKLYAKTIQAMIGDWRRAFGRSDLPFGIIELCAGADPQTMENFELRMVDAGPFIREAQFKAYLELENVGWSSAYDQQVNWYHPQMKVMLAERMARWALATIYELKIGHAPAKLVDQVVEPGKIILSFDRELTVRDGRPIMGMAVAGEDQQFFPANARFKVKKQDQRGRDVFDFRAIEVESPFVETPVAVRYAWARCPLGNLTNRAHFERIIPLPSFRTDRWDWPEAPFGRDQGSHRQKINQLRQQARAFSQDRRIKTAQKILADLENQDGN